MINATEFPSFHYHSYTKSLDSVSCRIGRLYYISKFPVRDVYYECNKAILFQEHRKNHCCNQHFTFEARLFRLLLLKTTCTCRQNLSLKINLISYFRLLNDWEQLSTHRNTRL